MTMTDDELARMTVRVSGGPLRQFRAGWALHVTAVLAHYYKRNGAGRAVSLCGTRSAVAGDLVDAGTFHRCGRCARLLG